MAQVAATPSPSGGSVSTTAVQKLSLFALTAMVVGSHGGLGHLLAAADLRQRHRARSAPSSRGASPRAACTRWRACSRRSPSANPISMPASTPTPRPASATIPGFLSALGYWIGSCIGNVSYWVLIKSTLGAFFPVFGDGNTVVAIVVASIGIWLFHFMILRGVQQAAVINQIVTIAKIVPILIFIVILIFAFKADLFSANFYGGEGHADGEPLRAGPRDDARHGVRLPRHRGRERVLALRARSAPTSARPRSWASSA